MFGFPGDRLEGRGFLPTFSRPQGLIMPRFKARKSSFVLDDRNSKRSFGLFRVQLLDYQGKWSCPLYFNPEFDDFTAISKSISSGFVDSTDDRTSVVIFDPELSSRANSLHPVEIRPTIVVDHPYVQLIVRSSELRKEFDFEFDRTKSLELQEQIYLVARDESRCKSLADHRDLKPTLRLFEPDR